MKKLTLPAAKHFEKPVIDFIKTKLEIFKRLDENNQIRMANPDFKNAFPRIGGSIKTTVEMLLRLLIKKLNQNKLKQGYNTISFTYSYFIQHIDARLKKSALKEHFIRLCDTYKSIISKRYRDLLTLPGRTINCISLEFSPGIIQFTEPAYNQLSDMTITPFRLNPTTTHTNQSIRFNTATVAERIGGVQKISDTLGAFFKPT